MNKRLLHLCYCTVEKIECKKRKHIISLFNANIMHEYAIKCICCTTQASPVRSDFIDIAIWKTSELDQHYFGSHLFYLFFSFFMVFICFNKNFCSLLSVRRNQAIKMTTKKSSTTQKLRMDQRHHHHRHPL